MLVSLIIPCYNESEPLPILYEELCKVTKEIEKYDFEFLFVNDGSKDNTLEILKDLSKHDNRVYYISFSRNFGKESAMYAGLCNAKGDYVAIIDADMQDPPSLLSEMLGILESGEYDSVATRRVSREGEPVIRSLFARMFYKIINKISDADIVDGARDFRLMKREMVDVIVNMKEYSRFSKGIFGWIGFRTYWLAFKNVERVAGETKWSFWKLFKYSLEGIINYSQVPLSMASWGGILSTLISFVILLFAVIKQFVFGDSDLGWAYTACIIMFMGGIQLFSIGILGKYISNMYLETKKRPHYIIAESNLK